jgi:DNA-3-methyladenine glycosylase II
VPRIPNAVVAGADELAQRDPALERARRDYGIPEMTRARPHTTYFAELARAICYQQLAGRAAATIHGRFAALFDDGRPTVPAVLAIEEDALRGVGLSRAKAASIRGLAAKVDEGSVELDRLNRLPDDEVVRELTLVRGIGEWTAHMFLMFQLGRLDVWPTGDLGVRTGYGRVFGWKAAPTAKELAPEGERFRPFRSLVAWWCWRAIDAQVPD